MRHRVGALLCALCVWAASSAIGGQSPRAPGSEPDSGGAIGGQGNLIVNVKANHNEVAAKELERLESERGDKWRVEWGSTGLPEQMWGRTAQSYTGPLKQAAHQFIQEYGIALLGLSPSNIPDSLEFRQSDPVLTQWGTTRVSYRLYYRDIPVYGGALHIAFDDSSHVVAVDNNLPPITDYSAPAPAPFEEVFGVFLSTVHADSATVVGGPYFVVYPSEPPRMAYQFLVCFNTSGAADGYLIDAVTGDLIGQYLMGRVSDFGGPSPSDTDYNEATDTVLDPASAHGFDTVGKQPGLHWKPSDDPPPILRI